MQEDGFPDEPTPVGLHPEDLPFGRGQKDDARETGHVQVVEIRVVSEILRLGDHRGDVPVPDIVLDRFQVEFPDGGGGVDFGLEAISPFGERRIRVRPEGELGEADVPEAKCPGLSPFEERAQRD